MLDDTLTACKACGADAEIIELTEDGQHLYQGHCTQCDQTAQPSTNRQRAIDFWQSWQEGAPGTVANDALAWDQDKDEEDDEEDDKTEDAPV